MNPELILELCKYGYLDKDKIKKLLALTVDEVNLLGLIGMHRIGGMAFLVLKECNLLDKLNREFRSCLNAIYEHNLNLSYSFQKGLTYLSYIVDNADMPYVVLKGACLANLYPAGTRTSNDVDLLIRRQDIGQIVSLLKQEGFEQGFIRNEQIVAASRKEIINAQINRGEIIPLVKEVNWPSMKFMEIDINISLDNKAMEDKETIEKMLSSAVKNIQTEHGVLYMLSKEDFLIHLCTHLYKEAVNYQWVEMGRDLSLYKFSDIYMYCNKNLDSKFVKEFIKKVQEYKLQEECYYVLYYTNVLLGFQRKGEVEWILEAIKPKDLRYMNRIVNLKNKQEFYFKETYLQWMFHSNRRNILKEIEA